VVRSRFCAARDVETSAVSTVRAKRRTLERDLNSILDAQTACPLTRELVDKVARAREQLLTFCDFPGEVEATNNVGERGLRPCVNQRKVTNGYRAEWAAHFKAGVRTAIDTARLARRRSIPDSAPSYPSLTRRSGRACAAPVSPALLGVGLSSYARLIQPHIQPCVKPADRNRGQGESI